MSSASTCTIDANPDVSGIGIRVNLYITMLLLSTIPDIPGLTTPLLDVLVGGAGISGLALLITAIVQTAKHQLSLYHAIFVIHVLYFTGIMVAPSGDYRGNRLTFTIRALISFVITYGSFMLFAGYAFYVWATATTFGTSPDCNNSIKYIFFFKSVRATVGWLRKLWMVGLGLTLGLLLLAPLASCACYCLMGSAGGSSGGRNSTREKSLRFTKPLAAIYGVVMLELYEKRNKHLIASGEQDWTFGQIMALVQIINTFNEVLHFLISLYTPSKDEDEAEADGEAERRPDTGSINSEAGREQLARRLSLWKREKKPNSEQQADEGN